MPYSECCNGFLETVYDNSVCPSCRNECEWTHLDDVLQIKKTFITPPRDRRVTVRIYQENVSFHFPDEGDREFYWFGIDDWLIPERNWIDHMKAKSWVTNEMMFFLLHNINEKHEK